MKKMWGVIALIVCFAIAVEYAVSVVAPLIPFIAVAVALLAVSGLVYKRLTRW